jgi:hypothetical protein
MARVIEVQRRKYRIDGIQKALRMAERLGDRDTFNWAELIRGTEDIMKNAAADETSQEDARRRFLAVLADIDPDSVPAALRPVVMTAKNVLAVDWAR